MFLTRNFLLLCCACFVATTLAGTQLSALSEHSTSPQTELGEENGWEPSDRQIQGYQPRLAPRGLGESGLLLIPDSTDDRVMAFDPMTGDLVDANYIPSDPDRLSTPIQAILNASKDGFLVSDQLGDSVEQYDLDGNYVGLFAPAGGIDPSIIDNVRGIALLDDGTLLVTTASGANADAVAAFDTAGNYLGNRIPNGEGGLDGPFGILADGNSLYLTGDGSDLLQEFDATTGTFIRDIRSLDNFPEGIQRAANGNFLVGNFLGAEQGAVEIAEDGTLVGIYSPLGGVRAVYELGNGNLLVSGDDGVNEIDRSGNLVEVKLGDVNGRLISFVPGLDGNAPTLTITGQCPGSIEIVVTGATASADGAMLGGLPGSDAVPAGPCEGTLSGLQINSFLGILPFDSNGEVTFNQTVPSAACGRSLQLIDNFSCATSNVATIP